MAAAQNRPTGVHRQEPTLDLCRSSINTKDGAWWYRICHSDICYNAYKIVAVNLQYTLPTKIWNIWNNRNTYIWHHNWYFVDKWGKLCGVSGCLTGELVLTITPNGAHGLCRSPEFCSYEYHFIHLVMPCVMIVWICADCLGAWRGIWC